MSAADDAGTQRPDDPATGPSDLARRVGPVVALVGVLGAALTLAWIALAPDNVVGPITEAPFALTATAVVEDPPGDGCLRLVDGNGATETLCLDGDIASSAQWTADGALVAWSSEPTLDGPGEEWVEIDPATGATTPISRERAEERSVDLGTRFVEVDGRRALRSSSGDEDTVLDLGGASGRLDSAVLSPSGDRTVAVAGDGRVLVAETARPDEVYVWFRIDGDSYVDLANAVRWDG